MILCNEAGVSEGGTDPDVQAGSFACMQGWMIYGTHSMGYRGDRRGLHGPQQRPCLADASTALNGFDGKMRTIISTL